MFARRSFRKEVATKRRIGIAGKQFFALFATTMLLFFLLTWVNLRASRGILDRQSLAEARGTAEKTNQYLDLYLESVKSLLRYLGTEDVVGSDRLRELADMVPLVVETLYLIPESRVSTGEGDALCSRQVVYDLLGNPFLDRKLDPAAVGPVLDWTEPYTSNLSGLTIALLQRIPQGVAVVEINIELLREQIAGAAGRRDMSLLITSGEGRLILDDRASPFTYAGVRDPAFLEALSDVPYGASQFVWDGGTRLVVKSRRNALGWNVHVVVDPVFLQRELGVLYRNFRTIGALLVVVLLVSSFSLSFIITRPVRRLVTAMDRVQSLNQVSPISNTYSDELGDLVDSYNAMMDRINSLSYENNEYEWRMLQSQIGPHFLYNTLACISALTKRNRIDRVREALDSLVALLRYSFGRQTTEVSLRDELDMLDSYVRIQRIRYGDRFSLEVACPREESLVRVPALILQPIVENSVFYGFPGTAEPGKIAVTVGRENGTLRISVRDNGKGMSEERLETVREAVYASCDNDGTEHSREDLPRRTARTTGTPSSELQYGEMSSRRDRLNAIGLRNIHRRLQVHYGSEFGIGIASDPTVGTTVVLHLPVIDPT